ncbi:MAG: hypothetical protein GKR94_18390 [Gammaproteobacteria bacterium]|nr:hypothetical protein [Gammaproteobacteria bacterium]
MFMEDFGALVRPALGPLIALLLALAMMRVNLPRVMQETLSPRHLPRNLLISVAVLVITPVIVWLLATSVDLSNEAVAALVFFCCAPPIASSASLCFILKLDGALALRVTLLASLFAPLTGPLVATQLLGTNIEVPTLELILRITLIMMGGLVGALILRRIWSPSTIEANATAFDGVSTLAMLMFLFPLFKGVATGIQERPLLALGILALVVVANFGLRIIVTLMSRRLGRKGSGTSGLMWGNRSVAIYLAVLPESLFFNLFVALYQFPMYFTPLVLKRFYNRDG